jgi:murein DD-endopeptidase MepM/ murein hydrolase activator NlpD
MGVLWERFGPCQAVASRRRDGERRAGLHPDGRLADAATLSIRPAVLTQRFGPTSLVLEPPRCYAGTCYAHFHDGIDLAAPLGTPVRAMAAGRVVLAGRVPDGAVVVEIDHGAGVLTLYGHLEVGLAVAVGDRVAGGESIGAVGMTGNTTGPHLHFGVWSAGVPVDPLTILPPRS